MLQYKLEKRISDLQEQITNNEDIKKIQKQIAKLDSEL